MAATAPMRDGPPAGSGTGGDSRVTTTTSSAPPSAAAATTATNFEYDESEWDIGIGNLIIDLDADIEKTNEKSNVVGNLTSANSSTSTSSSTSSNSSSNAASMAAASSANAANGGTAGSSGNAAGGSSGGGGGKSNKSGGGGGAAAGTAAGVGAPSGGVEHSSIVDKGLKMKIKRTKSGSKSAEKHEIVKPSEQNGSDAAAALCEGGGGAKAPGAVAAAPAKHSSCANAPQPAVVNSGGGANLAAAAANCLSGGAPKRGGGSSHRRDKTKDKHPAAGGDKPASKPSAAAAVGAQAPVGAQALLAGGAAVGAGADLNGVVRPAVQRVMYPMQTNGPGPPNAPGPPPSPAKEPAAAAVAVKVGAAAAAAAAFGPPNAIPATCAALQTCATQVTATSVASGPTAPTIGQGASSTAAAQAANCGLEAAPGQGCGLTPGLVGASVNSAFTPAGAEDALSRPESPSSPPCKKLKTANCLINDNKETKDACVGTSISTMTEPDCLGPCEPGTSVTLEGIVWHETEGVLVVNVTWRGKTYVGTLLDCTRHDWAPPRFCDSPTSDLDARLPKGRGAKRGRAATNDLSNFTETRSSVHSKLRSSSNHNGSNKGNRKGLSNSPTPFAPPRPDSGSAAAKRKSRPADDESPSPQAHCKKSKPQPPQTGAPAATPVSPPCASSPVVFYECPETNCCKKYRHINGLKYHQSHAHGGCAADDDDVAKESGSMSETEELPSPVDQQSILKCERKDEHSESEPATPVSEPPQPQPQPQPQPLQHPASPPHGQPPAVPPELEPPPVPAEPSPPPVDNKTVVKPGVLRYGVPLDEPAAAKPAAPTAALRPPAAAPITSPSPPSIAQPSISPAPAAAQPGLLAHAFQHLPAAAAPQAQSLNPTPKLPQFKVKPASALLQDDKATKEKAAAAKLQQQRKKSRKSPGGSPHSHHEQSAQFKIDSSRDEVRSPAYSDISDDGAPVLEAEVSDAKKAPLAMDKKLEVSTGAQSPHAMQHYNNMYAFYQQPPYLVPSVETKPKEDKLEAAKPSAEKEKKEEMAPSQKLLQSHYFPYDYVTGYGYNLGPNYPLSMVSSSTSEKDSKDENSKSPGPTDLVKQPSAGMHGSQNINQYSSPTASLAKSKIEPASKMAPSEPYVKDRTDARSPLNTASYLQARQQQQQQMHMHQQQQQQLHQQMQQHHQQLQAHAAQPTSLHHAQSSQQQMQHQILQQQQQQVQQSHHLQSSHQSHDDMRRYFGNMFPEPQQQQPRRKDAMPQQQQQTAPPQHQSHAEAPLKATPPPNAVNAKSNVSTSGSSKHKEKQQMLAEEKKEEKVVKQEGVKPTMETQGPPPPPTSSYAYFPSHYLQAPYHSPIPFEQAHMYRGMSPMMVPTNPYGNSPYLHHPSQIHPQISRYHAPEDLSRPPSGSTSKALDMLHQASQYYPSSHKIHELQERAIKSPTPKVSTTNASSVTAPNGQPQLSAAQLTPASVPDRLSTSGGAQGAKNSVIDSKDSRSPPPQRHVHTHHHTHVGLGYPIITGQYPAPYQAAVLASEQAAGVASTGSNPYSPK